MRNVAVYFLGTLAGAGKFGLAGSGLAEAEAEAGEGVFFRPQASEEIGLKVILRN